MSQKRGIVEYFGSNNEPHRCGYCKGMKPASVDSGLWAHCLTARNYQLMIDRGWRRSGKYCYKPDLKKSCCPPYTIRCEALHFKLSKSQKRVLKAMYEFLSFDKKPTHNAKEMTMSHEMVVEHDFPKTSTKLENIRDFHQNSNSSLHTKSEMATNETLEKVENNTLRQLQTSKSYKNKQEKAKQKRIERSVQKIMRKMNCDKEEARRVLRERRKVKPKNIQKSLEERLAVPPPENARHHLEIRFVSTSTDEFKATFITSHKVYEKYQMTVHKDTPDECTQKQFKRFLIDNPFELERFEALKQETTLPKSYGAYHMQYWLDGELIAVGVIDILCHCISSVYFFYDPKYEFLSLGTYSALCEIDLVKKLNTLNEGIQYYYMGFYIHSCVKMKYKSKYHPSFLLCPESFTWHPIEKCLTLLDACKYQRLEADLNKLDEDGTNVTDEDILILFRKNAMPYSIYKFISGNDEEEEEVKEYAKLIGNKCSKEMLLYRG
ncbi:Arginyl-tRNA--protein transferase 1-like protein [Dinothrombium tinctorium]|uniref:Arginyl-tRNA--protein transferase 1 n=1 Tax=Dinothrombium tinctorium TaxID=1965070 RepID=A0A3S3P460_9ACAR|nr:Arginyl-tRNA--protein transferase 1-like protein [Dinothrombium tinctorium]RWS04731.1 Arginyl-tRNA--protein transferase 1-like protein [Dinothrombium tinctorium]